MTALYIQRSMEMHGSSMPAITASEAHRQQNGVQRQLGVVTQALLSAFAGQRQGDVCHFRKTPGPRQSGLLSGTLSQKRRVGGQTGIHDTLYEVYLFVELCPLSSGTPESLTTQSLLRNLHMVLRETQSMGGGG